MSHEELGAVRMYYESHGAGDPMLLLHGAFGAAPMFEAQIAYFKDKYRLFVPEARGRGRTADVEGPFTFELLAEDAAAFIDNVIGQPTHVVGASDGGNTALLIALGRPDLVRRLVVIGANYHYTGLAPEAGLDMPSDAPAWERARGMYGEMSPDGPEHWHAIYEKVIEMVRTQPTMSESELEKLDLPVLVMAGDDDIITPQHTLSLYESLPNGQLAVIPGASHVCFVEKPDLVNGLIKDFLSGDVPPDTLMPIRRA